MPVHIEHASITVPDMDDAIAPRGARRMRPDRARFAYSANHPTGVSALSHSRMGGTCVN